MVKNKDSMIALRLTDEENKAICEFIDSWENYSSVIKMNKSKLIRNAINNFIHNNDLKNTEENGNLFNIRIDQNKFSRDVLLDLMSVVNEKIKTVDSDEEAYLWARFLELLHAQNYFEVQADILESKVLHIKPTGKENYNLRINKRAKKQR